MQKPLLSQKSHKKRKKKKTIDTLAHVNKIAQLCGAIRA